MRESHQLNSSNEDLHQQSDRTPSPCLLPPSAASPWCSVQAVQLNSLTHQRPVGCRENLPKKQKMPAQSTLHLPAPPGAELLSHWALQFLRQKNLVLELMTTQKATGPEWPGVNLPNFPCPVVCILLFPNKRHIWNISKRKGQEEGECTASSDESLQL